MAFVRDLLDLPKIVSPYLFHPLTAAEIFLPNARPVSWFTKQHSFDPHKHIPSLAGKIILVTGGNSGLGKETIYQLARHRPTKIYLAARSQKKALAAINDIQQWLEQAGESSACCIEFLSLDLSDSDSVVEAARKVLSSETRLDVVILNAGIMATAPSKTPIGHDMQFGTNHVGHFLLFKLLVSLMERTTISVPDSDVRVIVVSSEAYHIAPLNIMDLVEDHEKLCGLSNYTRYGVSKAANILFASEIARLYGEKRITALSLHPGVILTQLYEPTRFSNWVVRLGLPTAARWIFDDVPHGAQNQLFLATNAQRDELVNGAYYTPVGKRQANAFAEDTEQAGRLWRWTEEQIKDALLQIPFGSD